MTIRGNHIVSAIALALSFSTAGLAQSTLPQPEHLYVVVVELKPDMVSDWINIQKNQLIPVQKKAGVTTRTTYQTVLGNTNEYVVVRPLQKYAQLDEQSAIARSLGAQGYAQLEAKLAKCVESRQVYIGTLQPELGTVPTPPNAPFAVFTYRRVAPGKLEDFQNFVKIRVLPLQKKAGARVTVARRGLGANNNDFVTVTWLDKLADLDAGPAATRVLGEAGAAKLAAAENPIAPIIEQVVRRRVPELSY